jgi:lycopene cyclase CruP
VSVSRTETLKDFGQPNSLKSQKSAIEQMRDAVNEAARLVINYCLEHQIGVVVFGWNKEQKQECN